jgi:hypothetical protein
MKTATQAIMVDFENSRRFFPILNFDPLQELLEGTFYTTIKRQYTMNKEFLYKLLKTEQLDDNREEH